MKWILFTCVAAVIFAATLRPEFVAHLNSQLAPAEPEEVQNRRLASFQRRVFAAGTVEGAQRTMELTFDIAGRVLEIPVEEGQLVKEGDELARLDDAIWRHKLREAVASLELARAERERLINGAREEAREVARAEARLASVQVSHTEAELNRAERLIQQNALSEQDFEGYKFENDLAVSRYRQAWARVVEIEAPARPDDIKIADAKIRLAESEVEQARTMLEKTRLRAPVAGQVLRIDVEPGELVSTERIEVVATLANVESLRIRAYVEELDALSVSCGQQTYAIVDGQPGVQHLGVITWVAPVMAPKQHRHHRPGEHLDVEVREILIALEDPQDLVIGLPVEVFIDPIATGETSDSDATESQGAVTPHPVAAPPSDTQAEPNGLWVSPEQIFTNQNMPTIGPTPRIAGANSSELERRTE